MANTNWIDPLGVAVDPIDVHLAAGGPPLLADEARERISVAHGAEEDDEEDWDADDLEEDNDDDSDDAASCNLPAAPHVVVHGGGKTCGGKCLHCGATLLLSLPLSLEDFGRYVRLFAERHAACPKKE